ncbi:uncharacterized protein LOC124159023 [Ischnura elegans]|uniref:uncharacterized protein LOC124159023 n=1 Tax=Ischnura elegans TaxID=197161 RepID=UPI001ED8A70A|nr:uncharacterized protein LOC124159023 [Ischnura elegans]
MRERGRDPSGAGFPADGRASSASVTAAPSPTHLSEGHGGGRARFGGGRPLGRSSKKSALSYSDFHAERNDASAEDGEVSEGGRMGRRPGVTGVLDPSAHFLGQRSVSLTALHPGQTCYGPATQILLEPRMAQLETLEAKMASIEVSLSVTPRRRRTPSQSGMSSVTPSAPATPLGDRGIRSYPSKSSLTSPSPRPVVRPMSPPAPVPQKTPISTSEKNSDHPPLELDNLKKTLREKETVIQGLKQQLGRWPGTANNHHNPWEFMANGNKSSNIMKNIISRNGEALKSPLTKEERAAAERKLRHLRQDVDARRRTIQGLQSSLSSLHVTDNIDVRIQQAELEFSLGREELELLTLLEQIRNLQAAIEESEEILLATNSNALRQQLRDMPGSNSLYWCLKESGNGRWEIKAVEVNVDLRRPSFSIVTKRRSGDGNKSGLFIEWASSACPLSHGDRIIEVNGESVIGSSSDEMRRILGTVSGTVCVVVLRKVNPTRRTEVNVKKDEDVRSDDAMAVLKKERDALKGENLRLTHRISYLEEQVNELQTAASGSDASRSSISGSWKASQPPYSASRPNENNHQGKQEERTTEGKPNQMNSSDHNGQVAPQMHNNHSNHSVSTPQSGSSTPRPPVPPKKPLRLSLPRATSLQSVESLPADTSVLATRKPTKRNHRGEPPVLLIETPQPPPRASSRADSCHSVSSAPSRHHHSSHRLSMDSQTLFDAISHRSRKPHAQSVKHDC